MKTRWKIVIGAALVVILATSGLVVYQQLKPKGPAGGGDSMAAMDMGKDSDAMASMDTGQDQGQQDSSMSGMDMASMPGMDMGDSTPEDKNVPGYTQIQLDARKQQLIGVKTAVVGRQTLSRTIRAYGVTSHDTDLYAAQQELISANRYYRSLAGMDGQESARVIFDSARKKLAIMGYSNAQINRLIARGRSDDSLIEGGSSSRAWIYAQIYQKDLPYVKAGQRVRITSSELAGQTLYGTIDSIDTVIDPETRSIRARILTDSSAPLAHESYVDVDIEVPIGTVVALPEEAVIDSGGRQIAFVSKGDGYFEPRQLVLGRHAAGYYEVISGVRFGEKVVNSANFFIDSESQLKAATGNMSMSH